MRNPGKKCFQSHPLDSRRPFGFRDTSFLDRKEQLQLLSLRDLAPSLGPLATPLMLLEFIGIVYCINKLKFEMGLERKL